METNYYFSRLNEKYIVLKMEGNGSTQLWIFRLDEDELSIERRKTAFLVYTPIGILYGERSNINKNIVKEVLDDLKNGRLKFNYLGKASDDVSKSMLVELIANEALLTKETKEKFIIVESNAFELYSSFLRESSI